MLDPRKNRLIAVLILAALLFCMFTVLVFSKDHPATSARAAALYLPETKEFLYQKNMDTRLPMASTTKIMTALLLSEAGAPDREVRIPPQAVGIEGSSLYLKEGEVLTRRDLLYGLLLRSANDAATAIALELAESVEAFAARMNEKAAALGLADTHFENPHGLDHKDHYTTAKDLCRLGAAAMEDPQVYAAACTKSYTIHSNMATRPIQNHNKLLRLCEGAVGVKTGFTKKSGRCLVGCAEREGIRMISVTLNAPDDWNDHRDMLDYGFSLVERQHGAEVGEYSYSLPVVGGEEEKVCVENTASFLPIVKRGTAPLCAQVRMLHYAAAPVNEGDVLGTVFFMRDGEVVRTLPLTAKKTIKEQKPPKRFWFF